MTDNIFYNSSQINLADLREQINKMRKTNPHLKIYVSPQSVRLLAENSGADN